jgi:hypothetical protein
MPDTEDDIERRNPLYQRELREAVEGLSAPAGKRMTAKEAMAWLRQEFFSANEID